ncbi:GNAT family N-acetyltransferase [Oxalobacter sp. OxGP1]|uniref:GNAT family N-acetyltransferase n=1 Tax=Oxalobacter paeniformigenes TaxID=2946594 RepID=UPI0022AE7F54|nr:hypothetical protein [Oxalobacter paeniformigenes]MCZ4053155.1 GNAT family N-acetyltransferase [Oxalobacter paeniformigenes]
MGSSNRLNAGAEFRSYLPEGQESAVCRYRYADCAGMGIRQFTEQDIVPAGQMAYDVWSYELDGVGDAFNRFIHEYLVRYYDVNRHYSWCVDEGGLDAFLLAGCKTDVGSCDTWFSHGLSGFSREERKIALQYRDYLARNSHAVRRFMTGNDVQMGLFMSRVSGTGRRLLDNLEQLCRKDGISNLYLWADATCHVSYYEKNGFEMMARFENGMLSDKPALDTCVFRKRLN